MTPNLSLVVLMSSFIKTGSLPSFDSGSQKHIPSGCKLTITGHLVCSTGIASLDSLLGDGLPVGRFLLLLEDRPRSSSGYANAMLKCFIAEGLVSENQTIFVGEDAEKIFAGLPGTSSRSDGQVFKKTDSASGSEEKMTIAWRYKHISEVQSAVGLTAKFGHNFDLGKKLDISTLPVQPIIVESNDIDRIEALIRETCVAKGLSRIAIRSLASPLMMSGDEAVRWLYRLKQIVRDNSCVLCATLPAYIHDEATVSRLMHLADSVLDIQSFAGTFRETSPAFKDYQGFIRLVKPLRLPDSYALALPDTASLAFKCKQRRFVIEKFHLPPEELDADPTNACTSTAF